MVRPSADDIGFWRRAMRDVAPLRARGRRRPDPVLPGSCSGARPAAGGTGPPPPAQETTEGAAGETVGAATAGAAGRPAPLRPSPPRSEAPPPLDRFAGLDRASAERLKRGRYPVEGRLDLHGMTQAEAHRALSGFVARSRAAGRRCVLVITGHGRLSGGVLKAAVPRWLGEPELRRHVLAMAPAQARDGGAGALYLLLRKAP